MLDTSERQRHSYIIADLMIPKEIDNLANEVTELDGLVNNAGIGISKPIQFIKEEELKKKNFRQYIRTCTTNSDIAQKEETK